MEIVWFRSTDQSAYSVDLLSMLLKFDGEKCPKFDQEFDFPIRVQNNACSKWRYRWIKCFIAGRYSGVDMGKGVKSFLLRLNRLVHLVDAEQSMLMLHNFNCGFIWIECILYYCYSSRWFVQEKEHIVHEWNEFNAHPVHYRMFQRKIVLFSRYFLSIEFLLFPTKFLHSSFWRLPFTLLLFHIITLLLCIQKGFIECHSKSQATKPLTQSQNYGPKKKNIRTDKVQMQRSSKVY